VVVRLAGHGAAEHLHAAGVHLETILAPTDRAHPQQVDNRGSGDDRIAHELADDIGIADACGHEPEDRLFEKAELAIHLDLDVDLPHVVRERHGAGVHVGEALGQQLVAPVAHDAPPAARTFEGGIMSSRRAKSALRRAVSACPTTTTSRLARENATLIRCGLARKRTSSSPTRASE
jgi:hypothetical protein